MTPVRNSLGVGGPIGVESIAVRLAWITGLRLAVLTSLLAGTTFLYLRGDLSRYPASSRIVLGTIAAGYALAAAYGIVLRSGKQLEVLAYAQLALDQLTWTAIVYVSGGATSGATSFYGLTCLVGALLVGLRGAGFAAAWGMSIYTTLCVAFHFHWLLPPTDQAAANYTVETVDLIYPLLVNALAMTVVALLAGYLAERLRITGGALAEVTKRALDAERLALLGAVAAGLAHEIRNPLGSIRGSIEMLRESEGLTDEDRYLCDIVHREAARLNHLVGDMVDLSKPRPPRIEAVDVAAVARDVVSLASHAERSQDVRIEYDGPSAPCLGRADGEQLRQVVWNLVRNAMQASPAGCTVRVRVEPGGPEVALVVEDQGPGIANADRAKVFEAFYTTRTHGAGIGLAVVKRIMDDHAPFGATIDVEPREGGGTRFRVSLKTDVTGLRASVRPPPPIA